MASICRSSASISGKREAAVGMDRGAAGQRPEEAVCGCIKVVHAILAREILDDGLDDVGYALVRQQRRDAPQRKRGRADRIDLEPGMLPGRRILEHCIELVRLHRDDERLEEELRCRRAGTPIGFELLVEHALVSRVHVDQDEALIALGQDVDAVQLRERDPER